MTTLAIGKQVAALDAVKMAALLNVADAARDVWVYVVCCQGWDDCVKVLGDTLDAYDALAMEKEEDEG